MDWGSGLHVNGHFMSSENPPLTRIPAGAHAHLCGCCAPLAANVASLKAWSTGENGKVPPLGQKRRARGRRSGRSPPLSQLTALASGASTRRMHNTDAHRDACAAALANPAALH